MEMNYDIKFDKKNSNLIIIKKDGKVINYICCPPCKSGCDIISFNAQVNNGYTYNFDGLIVMTSQVGLKTTKKVYYKNVLLDSILY